MYLIQAIGEDRYTGICEADMNKFKKAGVYNIAALDSVERKIVSISFALRSY